MREFMDYILRAFSRASGATQDNSYSDLNETANSTSRSPSPIALPWPGLAGSQIQIEQFARAFTSLDSTSLD